MHDIEIEYDVTAVMRDGVRLKADVYRPAGSGQWPVLVHRTPYGKRGLGLATLDTLAAVARGYLVVHQDVRGCFASEGQWQPLMFEREDGYDTVRWAAGLPGSNGVVGMFGGSYVGSTQWSAAISAPPELKTIAPQVAWSDPADGALFRGGALELGVHVLWSLGNGAGHLAKVVSDPEDLTRRLQRLLADVDSLAGTTYWELPSGRHPALARHGVPDLGAERALQDPTTLDVSRVAGRYDEIGLPTFNIGGWYDAFLQGTIDNYVGMRRSGAPAKLVIGPWTHASVVTVMNATQIGEVNYGIASAPQMVGGGQGLNGLQLRWFDHWLKGVDTGLMDEPPILLFVMGLDEWREEHEWPLARAVDTELYLRADHSLSWDAPGPDEAPDSYLYDPSRPVRTHGGPHLTTPEFATGPVDQQGTESRSDVLVYTTGPLTSDLEVTGPVRALLFAATDAPSTDWVVRLCDVDEEGVSRNVTDGVLRTQPAEGVDPPRAHEVDLWSTSIVFRAGHRIRVQITSSNFPRWDRNLNTGERCDRATDIRTAHQTVYHDADRLSRLVLPTVPPAPPGGPPAVAD